jgi:hypothetical protein
MILLFLVFSYCIAMAVPSLFSLTPALSREAKKGTTSHLFPIPIFTLCPPRLLCALCVETF